MLLSSRGSVPLEEAKEYAKRGRAARPAHQYRIEGKTYTIDQLAAMAKLSNGGMSSRMARAKAMEGPVTLERLGIKL